MLLKKLIMGFHEQRDMLKKWSFVTIFLIVFSLFVFNPVNAVNIKVVKNAPAEINFGDILEINISIENLENKEAVIYVEETISGADPIDPPEFVTQNISKNIIGWRPPHYEWNLTLKPKETKIITYKIKPKSFGEYSIGPTIVTTSSGEIFYSNSLSVLVSPPSNGLCEPDKGENYFTNPKDCPSGSADRVCDLIGDGICDPDCTPGSDPDCPFCGNEKCEENETYKNCPKDCPSGSADNYCDGLSDGKCDSDCERSKDLDCLCNKDGVCESKFENYVNCPQDCKKPSGFIWIYITIGIIIGALIIFFLKKRSSKTRKDWENIYYGNK